jgi:hypothetical protein
MKTKKFKDNQLIVVSNPFYFQCCDCGLRHKITVGGIIFKLKRQNHFKGLPIGGIVGKKWVEKLSK